MGSRGLFWVMLSWRLGEHPSVSKTVKDPGGPLIYDIWEEKEDPQGPEKEYSGRSEESREPSTVTKGEQGVRVPTHPLC